MNTDQIQRLKVLPRRDSEIWQGGVFSISISEPGASVAQNSLYVPVWLAVRDDKVHSGKLQMSGPADPAEAVSALLDFALESQWGGYRPGIFEVIDPDLARQLAFLAEAGIEVRLVEQLAAIDEVIESLRKDFAERFGNRPQVPAPLDGRDVTVERMRSFAEAAVDFHRAKPWQYLTDADLIRIEKPEPPQGMQYATLLGAGRAVFGMSFYRTLDDYAALRRFSDTGDFANSVWQVTFTAINELPPADEELWRQHDLPRAAGDICPLAIWIGRKGKMKRASASQLAFLEGVLRAWAATTETEIDSGRWQKTVRTFDGESEYTLTLPDLLKHPSHQEWMRRGFEPDRRAHERTFTDINRYFAEHPPASVDEMNAVLNRRFVGRRYDQSVTKAETPLERAQELCYDAFDTHGRRRVQLARQALELYPDCADAYVILAEQAGTLEAELENYAKAVESAERALGREAFKEHAGHFWGVTETRPYMRARAGLALSLEAMGRLNEAADHYQALLELNPNDNQGLRYSLMPLLLQLNRDADAARLLKAYDETSANWTYARALLAFRLSGRSVAARREFRTAFRSNPHVPDLLLSGAELPPPPHYELGSPEEAIVCAEELRHAFEETPEAMDWLATEYQQRQRDAEAKQKELRRKERQKRKRKKR